MAGGDGGARGGGPVSRELRAGLRRERHRGSLPRGARGAGSVTDLLSLTPDAARAALAQWLAAHAQPGYRLTQILPRLWQRPIGLLEGATDPHPTPPPTSVVFGGRAEPLLNWDAVDTALTILNHPDGFGIGARHFTVSTVGILPNLARLAQRPEQFRLAVSLHAPTAELRRELMPIEKKYSLPEVVQALAQFRRRVTLEYVLIGGKNDSLTQADELAQLARPLGALVNLLPLHPGGAPDLTPSDRPRMLAFERRLKRHGVEAVLRRSRGLDISAACGQLRVELEARRKVRAEEHARVE